MSLSAMPSPSSSLSPPDSARRAEPKPARAERPAADLWAQLEFILGDTDCGMCSGDRDVAARCSWKPIAATGSTSVTTSG